MLTNSYMETVLGVPRNADDKAIKKAYRKLAMKWHPDKHTEPATKEKAEKNFMRIAKAYETLSDPEKVSIINRHRLLILLD